MSSTIVAAARIASAILVMPYLVKMCPPDEVAVWYVLMAVGTAATYLELGLSQNAGRFIAQAWSGAESISPKGICDSKELVPNSILAKQIAIVSMWGNGILALFSVSIYAVFIGAIVPEENRFWSGSSIILISLQSAVIVTSLMSRSPAGVLQGVHRVHQANNAQFSSLLLQLILSLGALHLGYGTIGVLSSQLIANVQLLVLLGLAVRRLGWGYMWPSKGTLDVAIRIWPSTWRLGLSGFAGSLMTQSMVLLAAQSASSRELAALGVFHQIVSAGFNICLVGCQATVPRLVEFLVQRRRAEFIAISAALTLTSVAIFTVGAIIVVLILPEVLQVLAPSIIMLPTFVVLLYTASRVLELTHCCFVTWLIAENETKFSHISLISCVIIYSLGYILGTEVGMLGAVALYFGVQLVSSNWYPPYLFLRRNSISLALYAKAGFGALSTLPHFVLRA